MTEQDRLAEVADNVVRLQAAKRKAAKPRRLVVQWPGEIRPHLRGRYLVKGLLPTGTGVIFGRANAGKTAVAGDLALHLAAGLEYRGRPTRSAFVVWVALEAQESWANRVVAWCRHHQIEPGELRLATVTGIVDLRHVNSVRELIEVLAEVEAQVGEPVDLVVFDTLARALPGANENDSADMGAAIASLARIAAEMGGASVMLLHHVGKDEARGPRGHSSLLAAVDSAFEVKDGELIVHKARDSKIGAALAFELRGVEIGTDEDGEPVTAVVALAADAPVAHKARAPRRFADGSKLALKVLRALLRKEGAGVAGLVAPPGTVAVTLKRWRQEHQLKYGGSAADSDASGAERQAWRRAMQQLQAANIITIDGEWVYANDRKPDA